MPVTIQFFVKYWTHFLISSVFWHIYSLKLDCSLKCAISLKVRATRLWNKTLNFFFEILIERYDWPIYNPEILTLFQISSNISGSCHLNHFLKIFLWVYLWLLREKCNYNQEKISKWKRHIWRTLQYQKHRDANTLMFRFGLIKIISPLVNFHGFGDNVSLLDQNCS